MNAKNRCGRTIIIYMIILFVLACNLPGVQISAPPTIIPLVITATQPSLPQNVTSSETPTITPTSPGPEPNVNVSGGGTATPTSSPTPSPTPTLPDFDPVINFGGGGAGGDVEECNYPMAPNAVSVDKVEFGDSARLCFTLRGMDFNRPFQLELVGPDGRILQSPDLFLNQNTRQVLWPQGDYGSADWTSDGTFFLAISLGWPITLPVGKWTVRADGDGFGVEGNFMVIKKGGSPYIRALNPRSEYEIMPPDGPRTKDNGNVIVAGIDFPARVPVFVLLYRDRPVTSPNPYDIAEYELIQKQVVTSDSNGSITTELSGPFEPYLGYLVYGITDPYAPIGGGVRGGCGVSTPCDSFEVISGNPTVPQPASSCPGAPAQRMTVNQRGYVCTKEDAVKLRTAPKRSGSEIMQLPPGVSFAVIEGPSCADNWSWWKIRLDNGTTGWISEGGDEIDLYFICP